MDSLDFIKEWQECELEFKEKANAFHAKLLEKLADFKEELVEPIRKNFSSELKKIFEKHSCLQKFSWRQYTSYWNDGEETYFRCIWDDIEINDIEYGTYRYPENDEDKSKFDELSAAGQDISKLLKATPVDLLEFMFGDHCKIIVTKEGIDIESYKEHS